MAARIFSPETPLADESPTPRSGSHAEAGLRACWRGLIYELGQAPGLATVQRYLSALQASEGSLLERVRTAFCGPGRGLRGQFLLLVEDEATGERCAFIDHAGMFKACRAGDCLSVDYLSLVDHLGQGPGDFSLRGAVEFLNLGHVCQRRTLTDGVSHLGMEELLSWDPQGRFQVLDKGLGGLESPPALGLEPYFEGLALSLANETVSVDLTGGFDSRLVAALLSHAGLDFEVSLSGRPENADYSLAQKAADALGKSLNFHVHDPTDAVERLPELFEYLDGHGDLMPYDRIQQWQAAKEQRGISFTVSGAGGENFNDFWWLQDFPRYGKKSSNLARLYDLRMCSSPIPLGHLALEAVEESRRLRERRLNELSVYLRGSNTQTYDSTFTLQRMPVLAGRSLTSTTMNRLPVVAPLLDWDLASLAYQLPKRQRILRRYHREWLSRLNPTLADCASTNRVSTAWSRKAAFLDPPRYVADLSLRLANKLSTRFLARGFLHDSPDDPTLRPQIRRSAVAARLIQRCVDGGILSQTMGPETVRSGDVGRLLCMGLLLERLDRGPASSGVQD